MRTLPARLSALAVAASVLVACASASPPASEPEPRASAPSGGMTITAAGSLEGTGRALADLLKAGHSDYEAGRTAVGWNSRLAWLVPLGEGFAHRWHGAVLLTDIGVLTATEEQAFVQLDPSTFGGLFWLTPDVTPQGDLVAIRVSFRSTRSLPPAEYLVAVEPPLALVSHVRASSSALAPLHPWLHLDQAPSALFWEAPFGRLWLAFADRIERRDPVTRQAVQTLPLAPGPGASGPVVLGSLGAEGDADRVGYFDGAHGGWWYVRGEGGAYKRGPDLQGFPLAERLQRFLSAPYDSTAKAFDVADFKAQHIASCADMARFLGPGGSLFGLLGTDGSVSVLRGSDLGVEPGPQAEPAAAIAGGGSLLFLAGTGATPAVLGFRLTASDTWEKIWETPPLPQPIRALSWGLLQGKPVVFIAVEEHGEGDLYAAELPSTP